MAALGRVTFGCVGLDHFWIGTSHEEAPMCLVSRDRDDARETAIEIVRRWNLGEPVAPLVAKDRARKERRNG